LPCKIPAVATPMTAPVTRWCNYLHRTNTEKYYQTGCWTDGEG